MEKVRLGRTNIVVNRNGFGALPVQRVNKVQMELISLIQLGLIVIVKKK